MGYRDTSHCPLYIYVRKYVYIYIYTNTKSIARLNKMAEINFKWIKVVELCLLLIPADWLHGSAKLTSYKARIEGSFSMEY